jgi:hypothetical protein
VVLHIKTKNMSNLYRLLVAVISCLLISACSTAGKTTDPERRASLDTLLKQADGELVQGRSEQSIALLNQAARENPTSMQPWLKMANIWFNAANYPSAILSANEVLKREADNQEAKSILVVAGLRVAAGAITGLVQQNQVNYSARTEAENLTKALRVALGEKVLVPGAADTAQPPAPAPATHRYKHVATSKRAAPPRAAAPIASAEPAPHPVATSSGGSDPFKSLK